MINYVCGICGKKHEGLDEYLDCVAKCGKELKAKEKIEEEKKRLEKLNAALNGVKQAKKYYEDQLEKFKKEYPEEYKLNFGDKHKCSNDTCKCKSDIDTKTESIKLLYEDNGKDNPKIRAKVNGKEVEGKELDKLFDDPETKYIAKLLGIL